MTMAIYLNDWERPTEAESLAQLKLDFGINAELRGAEIIAAGYTYESYSGRACVVFRCEGKLYWVHASHCSCHKLEEQWMPEETSLLALKYQARNGWDDEIRPVLYLAIHVLTQEGKE
jgi:hypothetical protein